MTKKILVTGGTGFIGRRLVSELIANDYLVRILTRCHPDGYIDERVEYFTGNCLKEDVRSAFLDIDTIYHLAVTTIPGRSNDFIQYDALTNLIGSVNFIHAAAEAGIKRFIFVSSGGSIYGPVEYRPISEDHITNPISAHGVSKLAVEKYLEVFRYKYQMEYRIARGGNPFGEGQDPERGQGFVTYALNKLALGEEIVIWGDGSVVRDFFYVGDFIDALLLMLDDKGSHRTYNIGSGQGRSLNEMIKLIESTTGLHANVRYEIGRTADVPYNCLDISRARNTLGWEPRTSIVDSLMKTWIWIQTTIPERHLSPRS